MNLPPPGSPDTTGIASFVDLLVRESVEDQRRVDFLIEAERGFNLYIGNHFEDADPADKTRIVLNRIQNIIISLAAIQAGDPPKITFTPRETNEPAVSYLNVALPEAQPFMQILQEHNVDPNQPLDSRFAEGLKADIEMSEFQAAQMQAMGMPAQPKFPKDLLVEITDQTAAQALQTVYDGAWEEADGACVFCENIINKNILGWQPTLVEFDDDEKRHILTNVHPMQVFVDRLNPDVAKWHYAVYDQPVSADEAKKKWPHLRKKIDDKKDDGNLQWVGSRTYAPADMYMQPFKRDMIVVRTAWIRYQPYLMTPDEAVKAGKLEQREVPDEQANVATDAAVGGGIASSTDSDEAATAEAGLPVPGMGVAPAPTRIAHFAPGGSTEIVPTIVNEDGKMVPHPQWPVRFGIRQVTIIADITETVDDRECEAADIPIPANKNVPIPFSPYGQGEPKRLEGLQMAINRCLSAIVTHQRYNAYPPEVVKQSVVDRMDAALQKARTQPGQRIVIPKALENEIKDVREIITTLDPPSMPADVWKLLDLLLQLIDREGNQAEVTQGNASATWSGETVKALQNAASQIIRGKSMFTEFYLKRIARLMVHNLVTRLGPEDWKRYLSRYPIQALQALHDRVKSLDIDISVAISSGSGASKAAQTQNIIAARQSGLPVSPQTELESLDLDADTEMQNIADWQRKQQMLMPQMATAQPASNNTPAQQQPQQGAPANV